MSFTIAIDGPAAAGKGTISKAVAAHFGFAHLDTGLLYRAVGALVRDGREPVEAALGLTEDALAAPDRKAAIPDLIAADETLNSLTPDGRRRLQYFQDTLGQAEQHLRECRYKTANELLFEVACCEDPQYEEHAERASQPGAE